jgi:hypothetical protein
MFKSKPKKEKTRIVVQYDAGFANQVFLRGSGIPELNWGKGVQLKNVKNNEWVWETDSNFASGEFKVLINDQTYEAGGNHHIYPGTSIRINPKF